MPPSHVSKELFSDTSKEMSELQKQVADVERTVLMEWEGLVGEPSAENINQAKIYALKYESKLAQFIDLSALLVKLYQDEINKLEKLNLDGKMNDEQKSNTWNVYASWAYKLMVMLKATSAREYFLNYWRILKSIAPYFIVFYRLLVSDARKPIHKTPWSENINWSVRLMHWHYC